MSMAARHPRRNADRRLRRGRHSFVACAFWIGGPLAVASGALIGAALDSRGSLAPPRATELQVAEPLEPAATVVPAPFLVGLLSGTAYLDATATPLSGGAEVADLHVAFAPSIEAVQGETAHTSFAERFEGRGLEQPAAPNTERAQTFVERKAPARLAALPPAADLQGPSIEDAHPPRTAFYDISARAVYLPSGEKLEAHSGLGPLKDNPRHVHVRMRGSTPPNVYRLRLREARFHGVQAIRLLPENEDAMFGRDGILAHTYLLGPRGDSNGCVSFKDYRRFLNAFLRGEVERLVVVAKLERPPRFYNGNEPVVASKQPERRAARRLAYAPGDKPAAEDQAAAGASLTEWVSSFRSGRSAARRP